MNKKLVITILMTLVLFIAAECGSDKEEVQTPFIGGTEGVVMSFKETSPTSSFQKDDQVPIVVVLKNKGEHDLKSGDVNVRLFGLNLENFNLQNARNYNTLNDDLRGADKEFFPEGGEEELNLGTLNYKLDVVGGLEKHTLSARACYPYQTTGVVDVCIKSELAEDVAEGICSLEGEKVSKGFVSKAPVQITSITEETRGRSQVKFNIKIENQGTGTVYSIDSNCQELEDNSIKKLDNKDKIKITITNPEDIKCGPEESNEVEVTLNNNQYVLTCWSNAEDTYKTKLTAKLDYLYLSEISKELTIYSTV